MARFAGHKFEGQRYRVWARNKIRVNFLSEASGR